MQIQPHKKQFCKDPQLRMLFDDPHLKPKDHAKACTKAGPCLHPSVNWLLHRLINQIALQDASTSLQAPSSTLWVHAFAEGIDDGADATGEAGFAAEATSACRHAIAVTVKSAAITWKCASLVFPSSLHLVHQVLNQIHSLVPWPRKTYPVYLQTDHQCGKIKRGRNRNGRHSKAGSSI